MNCNSLDLTIDRVLADPVIGAAMRADRVDPGRFETLLRSAAQSLKQSRNPAVAHLPATAVPCRDAIAGASCRW